MSSESSSLPRKLSDWEGAPITIANVIGVVIFTTPGIIADIVFDTTTYLGVWVVGGGFAHIGAYAYSGLATLMPKAGGEYIYIRKGLQERCLFVSIHNI